MKISKTEIKLLLDLYKSVEGLTPYTFYQRYRFSPATVFNAVTRFEKKNYLKTLEERIHITEKGKKFVENKKLKYDSEKFNRIPDNFIIPKIGVNEPYIPDITKISNEILNLQNNGDGKKTCI